MIDKYKQIAHIHQQNLELGFISSLGVPFLTLLYRAIDMAPNSELIYEEINGEITGFIASNRGMKSIYIELLKQFPTLVIALLPNMYKPLKLIRIFELIVHSKNQSNKNDFKCYELLSIAVKKNYRQNGTATRLYQKLLYNLTHRGECQLIIHVGENLTGAHAFYVKQGALPVGDTIIHGKDRSIVYSHAFLC